MTKKTVNTVLAVVLALMLCGAAVLVCGLTQKTEETSAASKIRIEEIEYDPEDREVSIEFAHAVRWKKAKVKILKDGRNYTRYIKELDSDECEVKVKRLKYGKRYKYRISGIKRRGAKRYTTISGTFRAIDR